MLTVIIFSKINFVYSTLLLLLYLYTGITNYYVPDFFIYTDFLIDDIFGSEWSRMDLEIFRLSTMYNCIEAFVIQKALVLFILNWILTIVSTLRMPNITVFCKNVGQNLCFRSHLKYLNSFICFTCFYINTNSSSYYSYFTFYYYYGTSVIFIMRYVRKIIITVTC